VHPLVTTGAEFHLGVHGPLFLLQGILGNTQVPRPVPDTGLTPIMEKNREK
jgi:hypothetical protein